VDGGAAQPEYVRVSQSWRNLVYRPVYRVSQGGDDASYYALRGRFRMWLPRPGGPRPRKDVPMFLLCCRRLLCAAPDIDAEESAEALDCAELIDGLGRVRVI